MLTQPQLRLLHRGLLEAFSEHELDYLLRSVVDVPIERLVSHGTPLREAIFEIIQAAERAGWTRDLVEAVYKARPVAPQFVELYQALGLASDFSLQQAGIKTGVAQKSTAVGPEQLTTTMADIGLWRERLAMVEACVCRVEVGTTAMGTGFLVAPDVVMTSYHDVASIFNDSQTAANTRVRFDYRILGSGTVIPGVIVELRPSDWDVDHSCYADSDTRYEPKPQPPTPDQLDYALLRLARSIGTEPRDHSSNSRSQRGWLQLTAEAPPITIGMPLLIAQYASGGPLKIAFDTNAVLGMNENKTRVHYSTKTEPGAGGAPCFDVNWQLVNGRKLTVKITEVQRTQFEFDAVVTSTDGSPLRPPVVFHLHDTYPKSVIRITKIGNDQTAGLYEVQSKGVYVIGAQVKDSAGRWIGLELDIAIAEGLPARFLNK